MGRKDKKTTGSKEKKSSQNKVSPQAVAPIYVLMRYGLLCWHTLLVGWERGWAVRRDITSYAAALYMQKPRSDRNLLYLVRCKKSDEEFWRLLTSYLAFLQDPCDVGKEREALDKWFLAHLVSLAESTDDPGRLCEEFRKLESDFSDEEEGAPQGLQDLDSCLKRFLSSTHTLKARFGISG